MLIPKYKFKIKPREAAPFTCDFTIFKAEAHNDGKHVEYRSTFKESTVVSFAKELARDLSKTNIEVSDEAQVEEPEGCL
jgi:hypothetical protein